MAKFINEDVYIEVDGHDISNHCFNIDTPSEKDEIDVSGFNPNNTKETLVGQRADSITGQALQDFASGQVHAILWHIYSNDLTVVVKVRPTSDNVSATNPELSGNGKMTTYTGLSGNLNERSEIPFKFVPADADGFVWSNT